MTALLDTQAVVSGLPDDEYHAHPALSSSGARKLLPPSCPARFKWDRDNPPPSKPALDFGSAAHKQVLGVGADLVVIDAEDWKTKAAQEARREAYAQGQIPLLRAERQVVDEMATVLAEHPVARALFDPDRGQPEQSLFWTDPTTGVDCRARLDWLPDPADGRMILADYKTTVSAQPDAFAKSCASYGYAQQAAWYLDAARTLVPADDYAFVFVAQEKTPPYLVTIVQLDATALLLGARLNTRAREVYTQCLATNTWPSYTDDVAYLSLPGWFLRQHEDLLETL